MDGYPGGRGGGGTPSTFWWAAVVTGNIELHIDADNNGTPETNWAPDRTPEERAVRNDPSKPGRLIAVSDGDSNTNEVPDFADLGQRKPFQNPKGSTRVWLREHVSSRNHTRPCTRLPGEERRFTSWLGVSCANGTR